MTIVYRQKLLTVFRMKVILDVTGFLVLPLLFALLPQVKFQTQMYLET